MEIDFGYSGESSNNEPVEPIDPINGGQKVDANGNPSPIKPMM